MQGCIAQLILDNGRMAVFNEKSHCFYMTKFGSSMQWSVAESVGYMNGVAIIDEDSHGCHMPTKCCAMKQGTTERIAQEGEWNGCHERNYGGQINTILIHYHSDVRMLSSPVDLGVGEARITHIEGLGTNKRNCIFPVGILTENQIIRAVILLYLKGVFIDEVEIGEAGGGYVVSADEVKIRFRG